MRLMTQHFAVWGISSLVTLCLALFGTFYDWLITVVPGSSVEATPHGDYRYIWGLVVLWGSFLGCLAGFILRNPKKTAQEDNA